VIKATHRPLYPRENDPVPIVQEAGWTLGPHWTSVKNLAPTEIRSLGRPARINLVQTLKRSGDIPPLPHMTRAWGSVVAKALCY
jgi:hypothetical protein